MGKVGGKCSTVRHVCASKVTKGFLSTIDVYLCDSANETIRRRITNNSYPLPPPPPARAQKQLCNSVLLIDCTDLFRKLKLFKQWGIIIRVSYFQCTLSVPDLGSFSY